MPWYGIFLLPFALIFRVVTGIRNMLFENGLLKSERAPIPTLIVGNLSVGGTGKTPMVEFLVEHLQEHLSLATLSRGYGRKTKGFLEATPQTTPEQLGDEPFQIFKKFRGKVPVFVGEDRVEALQHIQRLNPNLDLVVLDDAYQHRKLRPDFAVLLTPFSTPFFKDYVLPAGRLRESRGGAKRAEIIVVTKCPIDLSEDQKSEYIKKIRRYSEPESKVYFSKIAYHQPYQVFGPLRESHEKAILVSGLADDKLFLKYCKEVFTVLEILSFPDHHDYQKNDAMDLARLFKKHEGENPVLITTEKDAEKLKSLAKQGLLKEIPIFALPIRVQIEPNEKEMLLGTIRQKFIYK